MRHEQVDGYTNKVVVGELRKSDVELVDIVQFVDVAQVRCARPSHLLYSLLPFSLFLLTI